MPTASETKTCRRCHEAKPTTEYYTYKRSHWPEGRPLSHCKSCQRAANQISRKKTVKRVISTTHRKCSTCGTIKALDQFSTDKNRKFGKHYQCKDCNYASHLAYRAADRGRYLRKSRGANFRKRGWNITAAQYDELLMAQGGLCGICRGVETQKHGSGHVKSLAVDHDHKTGAIRGLLCSWCNKGLGLFRDDPTLLTFAMAYLARSAKRG
jgi:hypothetical protein